MDEQARRICERLEQKLGYKHGDHQRVIIEHIRDGCGPHIRIVNVYRLQSYSVSDNRCTPNNSRSLQARRNGAVPCVNVHFDIEVIGREMMRAVWLQAVEYESLGSMELWLRRAGYELDQVSLWKGQEAPLIGSFDFLIMSGGTACPTDELHYPWLRGVLALIRATVESGRHFFGMCLGAQLLGCALGGIISRNREAEFGWHTIRLSPAGIGHPLTHGLPAEFPGFHWHEDVVSIPLGAVLLAQSEACENQAFALGRNALGVQFHPEITVQKARMFVGKSAPKVRGDYVQETDTLFVPQEHFTLQREIMHRLLANLLMV